MTYDTFLRSSLIGTGSQSPMAKIEHWGIAALLLVATVSNASAQEQEHNLPATALQTYVQAWLGTMEADNAWSLDDPSTGVRLEADYSSIPLGGGVGQRLWGASVQIGFEGGGLVSFKNDAVVFAGADPGLRVSIDNEFFLTEVFMGGVVSLRPAHWLRLYAAAGPSIAWGLLHGEDEDDNGESRVVVIGPGSLLVIDLDETHSDFSFGFYGRIGIDFEFKSGFTFGVSARYVEHEMNFDERGKFTLDDMHWFVTLGGRI